jgi:DNA polymerase-3 subunit gamma/tau
MENFIVSARKYRPATFDSVVGQGSITTTLKNAIKSNHLAQAYLFCGPRGVGKTTCARIFAKTINCQALSENTEPCNQCESCRSFGESRSYNIHELDAASNNSVDDIRTLIEQVRIPPQIGKYSVYIIDEVHMLSNQAFNAFLKTLEEPPKHAVFILATTEKHKIIPTILSRCQIFDFSRILIDDTVKYLESISQKEGNEFDPDGLNIIAQKADGAMRDALSIYDQIVSFSGGKITYKNVIENLNVLDYDYYFGLTDAFLNSNIAESLVLFDEILAKGFDSHNFIVGLGKHFRDLLVCKDAATLQLLEVGNNIREKYKQQSSQCTVEFLFDCLSIAGSCDLNFKSARNQRLHVELALVQLCQALNKKKTSDGIISANKENKLPEKSAENNIITNTVSKPATATTVTTKTTSQTSTPTQEKSSFPGYVSTTPSIKNVLKEPRAITNEQKEEEKPKNISTSIRDQQFTTEQLLQAFSHYVESLQTTKPRLFSTLNQKPKVLSPISLEILLSNMAQQEDFDKNIRSEMVNFLRNELSNDNIVIECRISVAEEGKKLYTADEKLKFMISKNPSLGKLKQQFNLDFE